MKQECYNRLSAFVFAVIAIVHAVRMLAGWEVVAAGWVVPQWVSLIFTVMAGLLAVAAARLACGISKCPQDD